MKAPQFWSNPPDKPGLAARVLAPLGGLYALATAVRVARPAAYRAACRVISVGNLNVGGTGKTPTVIALVEMLTGRGKSVHVVTRGYGGSLAGPLRVDPTAHVAEDVGDEAILLAAFAPTWLARNRAEGVRAAETAGAEIILLDDAHQNPTVAKDRSIVVVDAAVGFGNGRVMPAGPLREPVKTGLARADLVLAIGEPGDQARFAHVWGAEIDASVATGRFEVLETGQDWQGLRVFAFAGIGRPGKFFATLADEGAEIVRSVALDDHQPLTRSLMTRLQSDAARAGAQMVTTEKDAVRLPSDFRPLVLTLPVRLRFDAPEELERQVLA